MKNKNSTEEMKKELILLENKLVKEKDEVRKFEEKIKLLRELIYSVWRHRSI